jgi:hypothetical protein
MFYNRMFKEKENKPKLSLSANYFIVSEHSTAKSIPREYLGNEPSIQCGLTSELYSITHTLPDP